MSHKSVPYPTHFALIVTSLLRLVVLSIGLGGCSVYMAANQPKVKDLSVLEPGTHRSRVIAEFGTPIWSGDKDGDKVDVFTFKDGYSTGAKTARALFHGVSDVFTLGLWEVISTPTEAIFSGDDMKLEVIYNQEDRVKRIINLAEDNKQATKNTAKDFGEAPAKPISGDTN